MTEWSGSGRIIQPSSSFPANVFAIVIFPSWGVRRFFKYFSNPRLQDRNRKKNIKLKCKQHACMYYKISKTDKQQKTHYISFDISNKS